ncbi:sigma-70 family RNA polymerase sigma factor [Streptomyces sp. SLBN-31]|uniref:sigma-70 family RNA polymerase sigma factor n=1 Tax=Streptomyces sp. SLBN-31 TaxID=2768444 RepID=UPI00114DEA51|nr:sigma-70 family RNA polymerase sigma factor [Streptomyces sp. SLBN-31]TQJ91271.1 RNA polymerase sigma-B factor [Streptomyces sp. SLBN-31]
MNVSATPHDTAPSPRQQAPGDRTPEEQLVHRMAACPPGPERESLREHAIIAFLPVARRIARRYGCPPENREDLYQVACLGLVKAVDRFDPSRGHAFLSYAVPTIDGEVKRHLRDHTWQVHVPRRVQEKHREVRRAQEEIRRSGDGRGGTVGDLKNLTGIDEEDIRLALRADQARRLVSMDEQRGPGRSASLATTLGTEDPRLDLVTDMVALGSALPKLPERERAVVCLYFFNALTQREVGDIVGISQMHVSRLLNRSCALLRRSLLAG